MGLSLSWIYVLILEWNPVMTHCTNDTLLVLDRAAAGRNLLRFCPFLCCFEEVPTWASFRDGGGSTRRK